MDSLESKQEVEDVLQYVDRTQDENLHTPLMHAIEFQNLDIIELLVQKKASPAQHCGKNFETPLHKAAHLGDTKIMEILLKGAKPHAIDPILGHNARTPLFVAIENGHNEIVQLLINSKSDVNICLKIDDNDDSTISPSSYAKICKNYVAQHMLLAVGAIP